MMINMKVTDIIFTIFTFFLSAGAFAVSVMQFHEKGFLWNNAYIFASKEERRKMDKKPYYRQSGFVFMLIGIIFLTVSLQFILDITWMFGVTLVIEIITVIYEIASTVRIERKKR